ncbi:MAG: hypothetical protein JRL30_27600, partial [Deltaproteobacteria bacterium]|nr:hypothetical protein [Deltaproteobacteria bacterium]
MKRITTFVIMALLYASTLYAQQSGFGSTPYDLQITTDVGLTSGVAVTTNPIQAASASVSSIGIGYIDDSTGCYIQDAGNIVCDGDVTGDEAIFTTITGGSATFTTNMFASDVYASGAFYADHGTGNFATLTWGPSYLLGVSKVYGAVIETDLSNDYRGLAVKARNHGITAYCTGGSGGNAILGSANQSSGGVGGNFQNIQAGYAISAYNQDTSNNSELIYGINNGKGAAIFIEGHTTNRANFLEFASSTAAVDEVHIIMQHDGDILTVGDFWASGAIDVASGTFDVNAQFGYGDDSTGVSITDAGAVIADTAISEATTSVSRALNVGGNAGIDGDLHLTGTLYGGSPVTIAGGMNVTGNAVFNSPQTTSGNID